MKLHGGIYPQDTGVRQYPFGAGGSGGLSEDLLPWIVPVDVFMTPTSNTNWNTISLSPNAPYGGLQASTGAQNAEINWDISLSAGTWTFALIHTTYINRGIYSVQLDGVEKGTIDGYSGSAVFGVRSTIAGIAVSTSGKVTLKLKMATKNASSSSYFGAIHHILFQRTA